MLVSKEEKIAEAVKRLQCLNYFRPSIQCLIRSGKVMVNSSPVGAHFYVDDYNEFIADKVKAFEKEYNTLVYAVIHTYSNIGETFEMLYVSDKKNEWIYEMNDLQDGFPYAYVYNVTEPYFSKIGGIGIAKTIGGGIRRTA